LTGTSGTYLLACHRAVPTPADRDAGLPPSHPFPTRGDVVPDIAVRAGNRAKLELIERIGPLRGLTQRRHSSRLLAHEALVPGVSAERAHLLDAVRRNGACVSSLDELAIPGTAELVAGLGRLRASLADGATGGGAETTRPPLEDILAESCVWQWGLREDLLDLAEAYLGLPARYYCADLRRERATGRAVGVRQWHRDVEDHRMFKILVWLNDVDGDGGPFEYVSRTHTPELARRFRYVSGFVGDEDMALSVPREEWRQATGPAGTAVLADTRALFHRAKPPVARDRWSVTFSFTSRTPVTTLPAPRLSPEQRALARQGLNDRQLACLPRDFAR
jgi:hypothetical protein